MLVCLRSGCIVAIFVTFFHTLWLLVVVGCVGLFVHAGLGFCSITNGAIHHDLRNIILNPHTSVKDLLPGGVIEFSNPQNDQKENRLSFSDLSQPGTKEGWYSFLGAMVLRCSFVPSRGSSPETKKASDSHPPNTGGCCCVCPCMWKPITLLRASWSITVLYHGTS